MNDEFWQWIIKRKRKAEEHIHESFSQDELESFDNMRVEEWIGFSYQKFKQNIKNVVNNDKFELLRGYTRTELKAGMLNNEEVDRMRNVFYEAFDKDYTIRDIKKELNRVIEFRDRLRMKDNKLVIDKEGNPIISVAAKERAIMIARTETIRLSGLGAVENYKIGGIEKVRWNAAISDRTCPFCMDLNGQIFPINNIPQHPAHVFCRCFVDYQIPIYTSKGWKEIGDIKVDDLVLTHTGKFKKVTNIIRTKKYKGEVIKIITLYNNRKRFITTTLEHPFLIDDKFVTANNLKIGDKISVIGEKRLLKNHNGEYKFTSVPIIEIKRWILKKARTLYNFSVEGDESYIAKGFVTHNCSISPVVMESAK